MEKYITLSKFSFHLDLEPLCTEFEIPNRAAQYWTYRLRGRELGPDADGRHDGRAAAVRDGDRATSRSEGQVREALKGLSI